MKIRKRLLAGIICAAMAAALPLPGVQAVDSPTVAPPVHKVVKVEAKPATCTEAGNIEYYKGVDNGKYYSDARGAYEITEKEWRIEAKGHDIIETKKKPTKKKEGKLTKKCKVCGCVETFTLPKKNLTLKVGRKKAYVIGRKKQKDVSKYKFSFVNKKKYGRYFRLDEKTGKITMKKNAKQYYKMKLNKRIPIKVTVDGKTYKMNVRIQIPQPKVTIKKERVTVGGIQGYRYVFDYNIKNATKVKVRVKGLPSVNGECDRDISSPKSGRLSYLNLSDATVRKLGNKVRFEIVAYYGKNVSAKRVKIIK